MTGIFNWFVKITGYLAQKLVFRTKVCYEDADAQGRHIKGPAIVISNHTGVMDYAMLIFLFFTRTLHCQAAEIQFDRPFMRVLLKCLGAIRVDRSFSDMSCMAESERILKKGGVVAAFPEGRLPRKGERPPLPFKTGVAYLALSAGVPVIPVYTDGNYFGRGRARVVVGKPIDVCAMRDPAKSARENLNAITDALRQKTYALRAVMDKEQQPGKLLQLFWHLLYDFVKVTAAIPVLVWLRPRWVRVAKESRFIRGAALVVGNHNSFYDPIALMLSVFYRRFRFVATLELFEGRFKGWLFGKVFRCIPIDRQRLGMQTFRNVNAALKNREVVAIFPEGHVLTDATAGVGAMHSGMVLMAAQGGCPIIPVYMQTPQKWYHRLRIAIGSPIAIHAQGAMPTMGEIQSVTARVSESMRELRACCVEDSGRSE